MKKLLITGATGLIGREILNILLKYKEYECWIISRTKINIPGVHIINQNLTNLHIDLLPKELDSIIYLAQADGHHDFPKSARNMFDVNIASVMNLLEYARIVGVKKFIVASSGGIYNEISSSYSEDDSITLNNQFDFYINTKLCAELLAKCYEQYFHVIVMRIFFAYGQEQKKTMLIPRLLQQIKLDEKIVINSSRGVKINPIYVLDVAETIIRSLSIEKSEVYNVSGNEVVQLEEIIDIIGKKLNKEPQIIWGDNLVKDCIANNKKMKEDLWLPLISITEGIGLVMQAMNNGE